MHYCDIGQEEVTDWNGVYGSIVKFGKLAVFRVHYCDS